MGGYVSFSGMRMLLFFFFFGSENVTLFGMRMGMLEKRKYLIM